MLRAHLIHIAGTVAALACAAVVVIAGPAAAAPAWEVADARSWGGAGGGWNGGSWRDRDEKHGGGSWTPEQTRRVEVQHLQVSRPAISPNGDGRGDEAVVSFQLARWSAAVAVRVMHADGTVLRELGTLSETRLARSFAWDGRDAAGAVVADGTYRITLVGLDGAATATTEQSSRLSVDVRVDTTVPGLSARRPTIAQLKGLARRAGTLRDARARWLKEARRHPGQRGRGNGKGDDDKGKGNGNGNGNGNGRWSSEEDEWVKLWESGQLQLPIGFTLGEPSDVRITARVGRRSSTVRTFRAAGPHAVKVVLPTYVSRGRARVVIVATDDAGNVRQHTMVLRLAAMPAPKRTQRTSQPRPSTTAPVTRVPTSTGGPFPDWLDPIMLRATYGAGVPQSWAKSQALANIVFRESSYRPTAQNPTSTAYGLFQFLDQTWATVGCRKTSDAYQQSVCGLRYIQRRYRTPERAWAFWQANHWY